MVHKLYLQHTLAECRTQERKISCKQERGITKLSLSLSVSTEARATACGGAQGRPHPEETGVERPEIMEVLEAKLGSGR